MTAPALAPADEHERLAAALHADIRPPWRVLRDLATVHLHVPHPRYGSPHLDPPGANRWSTPTAPWPAVKTGPDRWIDVATWQPLRDRDVAGYLPGRTP